MGKASFVPYEGNENYIFISYAHKDVADVLPIMERLHGEGYRIWYDDGIAPGSEWPEYIAEHLNRCAVALAFVSEASIASANCRREVTYALSKSKPFLSIVLRETQMSPGMELQLSAQQSILKYRYTDEEDFYRKLLGSSILDPCREPVQTAVTDAAGQPNAVSPVPSINAADMAAVERMSAWETEKANGAEEPWKAAVPVPAAASAAEKPGVQAAAPKKKGSLLRKILIIAAAVIAALIVMVAVNMALTNRRMEQHAAEAAEEARIAAAAIPQEVFLG